MNEDKYGRTIFVPVGASLIRKTETVHISERNLKDNIKRFKEDVLSKSSKDSEQNIRKIEWVHWRRCFDRKTEIATRFFDRYIEEVSLDFEISRRKNHKIDEESPPDKLSAELASLYLFYEEMKQDNEMNDEIILIASDTNEGLYCACFLADYLKKKEPYMNHISKVHVERIIGLDSGDSTTFGEDGIRNLINQTTTLIKERQGKWPLYLNVTGGYKGVLPYPVLLGLAIGKMDAFYLFELSPKIVWLPNLPVGFDILTWRNYRAFIRSIPHITGLEEKDLEALIPANMRTLLEHKKVNNKFPLTALGTVLHDQYEGERGKEISEYGRGYLLTDKIINPQKQQALRDCINRWQYLWLGDLIPETVEHARGHTQRVLELAAQILYPILNKEPNFFGKDQTDDNLLVLLSSIWLHDLGHSGDHLKCVNTDGTIKDGEAITRNIKGFPSQIRELHHLLSWYLIGKDEDKLFKSKSNTKWVRDKSIFYDNLIDAIRQVCLYHRGKMPVLENQYLFCLNSYYRQYLKDEEVNSELKKGFGENTESLSIDAEVSKIDEKHWQIVDDKRRYKIEDTETELSIYGNKPYKHVGIEIKKPLENLGGNKVNLPLLAALLRIADGGDVQEERTISQNYRAMRDLQTDRELKTLEKEEGEYREKIDESQLPEYLKNLKEAASKYFGNESREKYEHFDSLVNKCIQKYIQDEGLNDIDDTKIVLRNWLSALDQYVFKMSTGPHFDKHSGISAVMYLPDKPKEENSKNKNEYHYKVLAIHKEGKDDREMVKFIKNVKKVLTEEIKKEYEKVKDILNDHHIYFDTYWMMEEGNDEMDLVWPKMPSDFRSGT